MYTSLLRGFKKCDCLRRDPYLFHVVDMYGTHIIINIIYDEVTRTDQNITKWRDIPISNRTALRNLPSYNIL